MRIIVIPDSFKGSMSSAAACAAIAAGVRQVLPQAQIEEMPIADGGEGMLEAYQRAAGGQRITVRVQGPRMEKLDADFLLLPDHTAVIESAAACGLTHVKLEKRRAALSTTYGVGQLLLAALAHGCKRFIIGLGGSATNDGGMGLLCALGVKITDEQGLPVRPVGADLEKVAHIDPAAMDRRLAECEVILASDVKNPLIGPQGASFVFGPQKGATPAEIARLDAGMAHYAAVVRRDLGAAIADRAGAGAAGGLGGALIALCGARVVPGIDLMLDVSAFDRLAGAADLILTGEGRLDYQSSFGKAVYGVCTRAKAVNPHCRVIALCGSLGEGYARSYDWGLDGAVSIVPGACTLAQALTQGEENLRRAAADMMRILMACPPDWRQAD